MRLIDADAIKEELYDDFYTYEASQLEDYLKRFPTIEAELVRHGRWEQCEAMVRSAKCNQCKGWYTRFTVNEPYPNYCPNCGAKMDGDRHDQEG